MAVGAILVRATPDITMLNPPALLRRGTPGSGRVLSVRNSGTVLDQVDLVVILRLEVTVPDRAPYPAVATHVLRGRAAWDSIGPGTLLPVRVDPAYPHNVAVEPG